MSLEVYPVEEIRQSFELCPSFVVYWPMYACTFRIIECGLLIVYYINLKLYTFNYNWLRGFGKIQ